MTQRLLTRWFLTSKERGNPSTGLLTGSGEVDMAVGFGSVFALGFGVVLAALVAAAARFGLPSVGAHLGRACFADSPHAHARS